MYLEIKLQQVKFDWFVFKLEMKNWGMCDLFRGLKMGKKLRLWNLETLKAMGKLLLMLLEALNYRRKVFRG